MKNLNFNIIAAFLVNVTLKGSSQAHFYLEQEFIFTVDCVMQWKAPEKLLSSHFGEAVL